MRDQIHKDGDGDVNVVGDVGVDDEIDAPAAARAGVGLGELQDPMERAFGADFSGVRVAEDGQAEAIGAQAFAQGDQLHFASGRFDPATPQGVALIGHELTHVVQQRQGRVAGAQGKGAGGDPALEAEADAAGVAVARGEPVPAAARGGGGASPAGAAPIQAFEGDEHQRLGDAAHGAGVPNFRWKTAEEQKTGTKAGPDQFKFVLTPGDITALSGDLFDPRTTAEGANPDDCLWSIAGKPSSNPGKEVGTQDEVIWAIKDHVNSDDKRFQNICTADGLGGIWYGLEFSDDVKQRVESRYKRLAAVNDEHFVDPKGPGSGGPGSKPRSSAGGSYRSIHEAAILEAHDAKKSGKEPTFAQAREAAAAHFLTDAFSAGHTRTQRTSLRDHWDGVYPLFWENFKRSVAHVMAVHINEKEDTFGTAFGTVAVIEGKIWKVVAEKTATLPAISLGEIVSKVIHDEDGEHGLEVVNDVGEQWIVKGDGGLTGRNEEIAKQAVQLGAGDIERAYALAPDLADDQVLDQVRGGAPAPATPGDKYAPEQLVPRLDPTKENGTTGGLEADIDALWKARVRSDKPDTFGQEVTKAMSGGYMGRELDSFASDIDEEKDGVHPRAAFIDGFAKPLKSDPLTYIKRWFINFDPSTGHVGFNQDDAWMDYMSGLEQADEKAGHADGTGMRGMTFDQRVRAIKELIGGYTGDDEGERVIELFSTAPASDRPRIYQAVEGHAWTGDWIEGWFEDDDDIWNALSKSQLNRLRTVINGG